MVLETCIVDNVRDWLDLNRSTTRSFIFTKKSAVLLVASMCDARYDASFVAGYFLSYWTALGETGSLATVDAL